MDDLNTWSVHFKRLQYRQHLRSDDILAMSFIKPLMDSGPFLPFTNSSFRPFNLACILNDIVINRRKKILEFGSGISSILIGRLIQRNGLASEILSVEHDRAWADLIQEYIENEKMGRIVKIIHAPLKPSPVAIDANAWYDVDALAAHGVTGMHFDMVIIDGPPAWQANHDQSRYPAFPFVVDRLHENSVVYLDDTNRDGERTILQKWEEEHKVKFCFTGGTLAYFRRGKGFNPVLE